jgi:hypothetical protein
VLLESRGASNPTVEMMAIAAFTYGNKLLVAPGVRICEDFCGLFEFQFEYGSRGEFWCSAGKLDAGKRYPGDQAKRFYALEFCT